MDSMVSLQGFVNCEAEVLARLCFVSVRTVRRWRRTNRAPAVVLAWLELIKRGHLGTIDAAFTGWVLRNGSLENEHGWRFTPAELMSIPYLHSAVAAYRAEIRQLKQQLLVTRSPALGLDDLAAATDAETLFQAAG